MIGKVKNLAKYFSQSKFWGFAVTKHKSIDSSTIEQILKIAKLLSRTWAELGSV